MVRMIIVDDEYIILDSLKTLIDWKSIGVKVVGTADNGAAAIDLAIKQKPDIILSDISMPCFSGLEMLETLRRNNITTEVIFITAYGKFEYAQEAIHHGVFDYILKPIDEALLLSSVSRCAEKIRTRQSKQGNEEQRRLNDLILSCLLQGRIPDNAEWDLITTKGPNPEKNPNATVIGFHHGKDETPEISPADFHPAWISAPLRAAEDLTLFLICFPEVTAEWPAFISRLTHNYPNVVVVLSSAAGLKICFERAYAQITFTLIDAVIHRRKGALLFTNLEKSGIRSFPGFDSICSSLSRGIRDGKPEQVRELLYSYFMGFLEKKILYDSSLVELYCIELMDHVYTENTDYINLAGPDEKISAISTIKKKLSACSGLHQIFNTLCEFILDLCRSINNDQTHSSMRLVRQCIKIIQEQYGEEISLSGAAKQLYISTNYLSRIFSAEMGKSFTRYLLEYRIAMAKKLLQECNDKVYEIASRVGYGDVVHFSKIFKQLTGLSPNQYRNSKL